METLFENLRGCGMGAIFVKLLLATICGGVIGMERGRLKRPAGLRTHILVCIGSALIMITNQYMVEVLKMATDPSRMGAQVISGIGFLGAGTIIVVGHNQVKGLTTAAGLWACACMGLAIGIGFYEGAIICCIFLYVVISGLHSFGNYVEAKSKVMEIYIETEDASAFTNFLRQVKEKEIKVSNVEIKKIRSGGEENIAGTMTLKLPERQNYDNYVLSLNELQGIKAIEEIA